ncbi:MAG: hypothetical protein IPJ29_14580 [Chitinophagaceae bacterium]|nr:hypothetical protein [Chitinophagaceae bacterium]
MKKIILALFSFSACLCLNAQHSPNDGHNHTTVTPGTNTEEVLKFKETEHNFEKYHRASLFITLLILLIPAKQH